ncbi:MAG: hypothetical protein A4E65_02338 [Syntrophorhabdus sp. PtaU1.Bin153]|nr:MAG: hypothetical protein A4E65_02338 [Syntrophorhabdus sp. PtaU1.Bin153]
MSNVIAYIPGKPLGVQQIADTLNDGGHVFWGKRLMSKSELGRMPVVSVLDAVKRGLIRLAELNEGVA